MKKIMICPLDWGMGHATRITQLAAHLHSQGHYVIIAAAEEYLSLYNNDMCSQKIEFSSLKVRYSRFLPQVLIILLQAPLLIFQFFSDIYRTGRLVRKHKVDIVISDNRFGAVSNRAYSIYLTHQLKIFAPLIGPLLTFVHRGIASMYKEIWVPDAGSFLTGELSREGRLAKKCHSVGLLSMMLQHSSGRPETLPEGKFITVILSGPEPQRSLLEKLLLNKFSGAETKVLFAGGKIRAGTDAGIKENIISYPYLPPSEIKYLIENSAAIICRAGYSTIMDLVSLNRSAILIPTPGQTEQKYLTDYLSEQGLFTGFKQNRLKGEPLPDFPVERSHGDYLALSLKLFTETVDGMIKRSSSQKKQ